MKQHCERREEIYLGKKLHEKGPIGLKRFEKGQSHLGQTKRLKSNQGKRGKFKYVSPQGAWSSVAFRREKEKGE